MGHIGPAPLLASLALSNISSTISHISGDLPSGHVNLGMSRAHSWDMQGAEDTPPQWHSQHRESQLGKGRCDHKRNVAEFAMPLQVFSTSQSIKSAVKEKLEMSHAYMFALKKTQPNSSVSLLCLPRGSSNSSLWPSLLSFPLYNLVNSRISMVTTAVDRTQAHCAFLLMQHRHVCSGCSWDPQGALLRAPGGCQAPTQARGDGEKVLCPCFSLLWDRNDVATSCGFKHLARPQGWALGPCSGITPCTCTSISS